MGENIVEWSEPVFEEKREFNISDEIVGYEIVSKEKSRNKYIWYMLPDNNVTYHSSVFGYDALRKCKDKGLDLPTKKEFLDLVRMCTDRDGLYHPIDELKGKDFWVNTGKNVFSLYGMVFNGTFGTFRNVR